MDGGVAHDALLADVLAARLELRLDERDDLARLLEQGVGDGQDLRQRDEGDVDGGKVEGLADHLRRDCADVRALHVADARVGTQLPGQLAVADIDGVDLLRAVLQHAVSEAARRGADVGRCLVLQPHAEFLHRLLELEAAAADVGDVVAEQPYLGLGLDRRAGLVDLLPVDKDLARHDHALRALAAAGQSPLDEQDVQSFFCHSLTLLFLSTILYHACIMRSRPAGSATRGCARPSHRAAGRRAIRAHGACPAR